MKIALMSFLMASAFAVSASATMECKGTEGNSNAKMSILDLAKREVREGQKNPVAVRVTEVNKNDKGYNEEKVLFAGVVEGSTEDVMWFMKSKDRKNYFSATIYLDDSDQSIYLGGKEMTFSCEQSF
jgi:hypothetical protein